MNQESMLDYLGFKLTPDEISKALVVNAAKNI